MITIRCEGCRSVGAVNKITAGLRCTCGSTDIDIYEPGQESFLEFMGAAHGPGTGWNRSMPDPLQGWSQYQGPMPGENPRSAPTPSYRGCPNCQGSGLERGGRCRRCKGTGRATPTTAEAPEPLVARHPGQSTQTSKPFMGRKKKTSKPSRASKLAKAVREQNPGLGKAEVDTIVQYTLRQYGE